MQQGTVRNTSIKKIQCSSLIARKLYSTSPKSRSVVCRDNSRLHSNIHAVINRRHLCHKHISMFQRTDISSSHPALHSSHIIKYVTLIFCINNYLFITVVWYASLSTVYLERKEKKLFTYVSIRITFVYIHAQLEISLFFNTLVHYRSKAYHERWQ